ncbi:MAG: methyltransferase [Fibrobacter sp.]|jgi:ribosomal protein L11 methyltransferase|nr:methyltransferase [Fibrobacter sp.]
MKENNFWYKVLGVCEIESFELWSYSLFEAGVMAIEELEVSSEKQHFCFYTDSLTEAKRLRGLFPDLNFQIIEEEAKDWDQWWRDRTQPVSVSSKLWVRPPWIDFEAPSKDSVVLELEAKTAFGTGEHETTSSTASLMESIDFNGKTVLDIGTGTGILAMFAKRLGAKTVVGTEIDPQAVPCIAENFERNGFEYSQAVLGFLDIFQENVRFDVILCNMIRSELFPIRYDIEDLLAQGSFLVISGQLNTEKEYILSWFQEAGLSVQKELEMGEWWSVLAQKT